MCAEWGANSRPIACAAKCEKVFARAEIPEAVAADVVHDRGRFRSADLLDKILIDVLFFFEMKALGCLAVECVYFFVCAAEIPADSVGARAAQLVRGKNKRHQGAFLRAQPMNDLIHMPFESVVVADSRIALRAEKMMRAEPDGRSRAIP